MARAQLPSIKLTWIGIEERRLFSQANLTLAPYADVLTNQKNVCVGGLLSLLYVASLNKVYVCMHVCCISQITEKGKDFETELKL